MGDFLNNLKSQFFEKNRSAVLRVIQTRSSAAQLWSFSLS